MAGKFINTDSGSVCGMFLLRSKREQLEQMRQNIIADEIPDVSEKETDCSVKCSVNFGGVRFNKEP